MEELGRLIPDEIALQLQGVALDEDTFFFFPQDINNKYFLFTTPEYENEIKESEYSYLLDYPFEIFVPPIPTPPSN